MGGKTRTQPRTKNNTRPSSSSRTAELLGSTAATFVGFSATAEHGIVAFAPGFASFEMVSEKFDGNIDPAYLQVFRKMSKKDPTTKQKALQEFTEMINASDLKKIKTILPIWPKHYQTLATDNEHNVREVAQNVQQLLINKCNRAMAPYLKYIVPVWLASQFDNYAPAASVAIASFNETFVTKTTDRTQEVCLHCQTEIIEHAASHLTTQTPATLSAGKEVSPEEAEQKFQRVALCCLKLLSFFIENTANSTSDMQQVLEDMQNLLGQQKFWSYAKHKTPAIKSAWFEFIYQLLQSKNLLPALEQQKAQLINICFQNIDESEPLTAPHVWGCVLLLQTNYYDWYKGIDFKKTVLPKLNALLSNGFNHNVQAISPNMLPFISKLTQETLRDIELYDFYMQFFNNLKNKILVEKATSKSDYSTITKTFFECLRFVLQRLNNLNPRSTDDEQFGEKLIREFLLEPIAWFLSCENCTVRFFFQHTSALLAYMDRQSTIPTYFYTQLLNAFWMRIFQIISDNLIEQVSENKQFLTHVLELVHNLHIANPMLEDQKVKFHVHEADEQAPLNEQEQQTSVNGSRNIETNADASTSPTSATGMAAFKQNELRQLAIQLYGICMESARIEKSLKYIQHIRQLCKMFPNAEFYTSISTDNSLQSILNKFIGLLCNHQEQQEYDMAEKKEMEEKIDIVLNIIFEMLQFLDKPQRFEFIELKLLQLEQEEIQTQVLQRLLSYPLCIEPEILKMLSKPKASEIVQRIANEVIIDNSREKFNILHKCFFQTDSGEILINTTTVDAILKTFSNALNQLNQYQDVVDGCGSFIAQIMPVICTNENATIAIQHEVFLTLFRFTMQHEENDFISKDTLWELTTCWQDALSSNDIQIDEKMLQACAKIVEQQIQTIDLTIDNINSMAEAMAKFVLCSTENIENEDKRNERIDATMLQLFNSKTNAKDCVKLLEEQCLFLEAIQRRTSAFEELTAKSMARIDTMALLRRTLLNFSTILKLVCSDRLASAGASGNDRAINDTIDADEVTDDYCDPNDNLLKHWSDILFSEILKSMKIAALGDAFMELVLELNGNIVSLALELSEKVRLFLRNDTEVVNITVARLKSEAAAHDVTNTAACRALPYLINYQQFAAFDDNAIILLNEHLAEYFSEQNALSAYVLSLQYLLRKLESKTITLQDPIMRKDPPEIRIKAAMYRCLVKNNFACDYNEASDKNIIYTVLQYITTVTEQQQTQKNLLLYNVELHKQPFPQVVDIIEHINLLSEVLKNFPSELSIKHWDAIRLGLCSWVLSVSKSIDNFTNPRVSMFTVAVYHLFGNFINFMNMEKQRSSTQLIKNVVEEWHNLFARDVNIVLFKSYFNLCQSDAIAEFACFEQFIDEITPALELINYDAVYNFTKNSTQITLDNVMNFLLKNLSNSIHNIRFSSLHILKQFNRNFIVEDISTYEKKSESYDGQSELSKWHYLNRFEDYMTSYEEAIKKYNDEFSFKITEISGLGKMDRNEALTYFLLWDCIINACANSPITLRSVYTDWLLEHKYEEHFLHFLFRAMPAEILKNHCNKLGNNDIFKSLDLQLFKARNLPLERYACHLYTEALRKLPAMSRKWWNSSESRQKTFVDKLTQFYISTMLCNEELKAISSKREKHDNMQITVHTSTREVMAVYSIDEVRMELVITLAQNHPLGSVKVECGKQIGGRASSRNIGMQLTIFLTHQNGSLYDGLTLWKKNLDKKFEGVEECFVCYTVIHEETCQLPKVSCRTCRKKFHGPCLYKWFTTSNKSTCPICRNVF